MGGSSSASWDRSIPEEQRKIDEDKDSGELTPYEEAQDLSQEFAHIDRRTVDDDTVLCDVKGIYKASTGGSIAVEVDLPGPDESTKTFNFEAPKVWSGVYGFVRWVEHYGFSSSNFEAMIQEDVEVKVQKPDDLGEYKLFIPEQDVSVLDRVTVTFQKAKENVVQLFDGVDQGILFIFTSFVVTYFLFVLTINGLLGWEEISYSMQAYSGEGSGTSQNIATFVVPILSTFVLTFLNVCALAFFEEM